MELTIHRGSHEVGGSCVEVRSGDSRIVLDVGMPLFDADRQVLDSFFLRRQTTEQLRQSGVLPNVEGLFNDGGRPDAILLSHAHLDHTGLLNHSHPEIPVYASRGTSKMMLAGRLFAGQIGLPQKRFCELPPETPVQVGRFTVTGFPVDHSIYGCLALLIEADDRTVLYTGDLRLHGRKPGMIRRLVEVMNSRRVDAMLMEGTHFGFPDGNQADEYELETEITNHVREASGLVLASFSPQHVDRLVAFIRATKAAGRTFVADPYTAFVLHLLSTEVRLPVASAEGPVRVYVPALMERTARERGHSHIIEQFRDARIELSALRKQPDRYLMVFRPTMLPDFADELPMATTCLYSRWHGYLEHAEWKRTSELLSRNGGRIHQVHTSGHILSGDIVRFVKDVRPQTVIPIHTFEPQAFQQHFRNARLLTDGVAWQVG